MDRMESSGPGEMGQEQEVKVMHEWAGSPAARRACLIAARKASAESGYEDWEELYSEALVILTECATPSVTGSCAACGAALTSRGNSLTCSPRCRKALQRMRLRGAPVPTSRAAAMAHDGSMFSWPADQMAAYAVTQVSSVLRYWIRDQGAQSEVPSSQWLDDRADIL